MPDLIAWRIFGVRVFSPTAERPFAITLAAADGRSAVRQAHYFAWLDSDEFTADEVNGCAVDLGPLSDVPRHTERIARDWLDAQAEDCTTFRPGLLREG